MIHYANVDDDVLPRVRWNENGFTVPLFDEANSSPEQQGITKCKICFLGKTANISNCRISYSSIAYGSWY